MLKIIYEDPDILVVEKPVGMESQSSRGFGVDMVSEIKRHIHKEIHKEIHRGGEPYVGVIHRLDKPVSGVMVYAKNKKAAASLSKQVQDGTMKKEYLAVLCGKPVDNVGNYVDFLLKNDETNCSQVVDMGITGGKRAELNYRIMGTIEQEGKLLSLVRVELLTGRHHQIRVQFSHRGTPLWGDHKYNPEFSKPEKKQENIALCACSLSFLHPKTGKRVSCSMEPQGAVFRLFHKMNDVH
ncbi:MAG: RluA family pseudouridine synthase [Lachnospiraceae bacterium]